MKLQGLKLCLVGPLPPPAGGMAMLTQQLASRLSAEGVTVELVQVNVPYRPEWLGRVRGLRAMFRALPYFVKLWQAMGRSDLVHLMANSGWSWHLFAAPAIKIAAWRGVPIIVNYHGGEAAQFLLGSAKRVRRSLQSAAALLVPSGFLVDVFKRHGIDAEIVPNVVDLDRFRQSAVATHGKGQQPVLLIARNLETIYGIDIGLQAFAKVLSRYPQASLMITGEGPVRASLQHLSEQLGVAAQVHFTGRLDRNEMAELYGKANLLINPSRADNMPGAVLEAMASGVPIVATAVGGVPYIVEDQRSALLVPVDDHLALAEAVLRVLSDHELASRLTASAAVDVRSYDWNAVRPLLVQTYAKALRTSPTDQNYLQTDGSE